MFVRSKASQDERVESYTEDSSLFSRISTRVQRRWRRRRFEQYEDSRPDGLELFSQAWTIDGRRVVHTLPDADLYNLHWVNEFIDPLPFFQEVSQPVVWTLHDMNPFTGGCHYNVGCRRFEKQCGACPQLGSNTEDDLSRAVWRRKEKAYENEDLHVVTPSRWLGKEAQESALLGRYPSHVIPYGLDTEVFRPRSAAGMRLPLGIDEAAQVVLFISQTTTNTRKGFSHVRDALAGLNSEGHSEVHLVSIGKNAPNVEGGLAHTHLGSINSDVLLSAILSMANLFVISSRQDNLPNTVLEAMACGTPVVGYDTGGIPDMVRPGRTGWLAKNQNVRALRAAIQQALTEDAKRERLGRKCRQVVENEYTLQVQAKQYIELYEDILADHD